MNSADKSLTIIISILVIFASSFGAAAMYIYQNKCLQTEMADKGYEQVIEGDKVLWKKLKAEKSYVD